MLGANIGAKYVFAGGAGFAVQSNDRCKGRMLGWGYRQPSPVLEDTRRQLLNICNPTGLSFVRKVSM